LIKKSFNNLLIIFNRYNFLINRILRAWGYYLIILVSILLTSFVTINYAFAEIDISLTPDVILVQSHSLIIDIDDPDASGPIQVTIRADSGDVEIIEVNFDPSWGKYRAVIFSQWTGPISDGKIQAEIGDTIQVEYGTDSLKWKSVTFERPNNVQPSDDRWPSFDAEFFPGCLDKDGDEVCDDWEQGSSLRISDASITGDYIFDCSPSGGCDDTKKDIFVEIDWLESHKPDPKAIQQVIDAFANARDSNNDLDGIRLHIQVDPQSVGSHPNPLAFPGYDIDGYRGYDQLKFDNFGTPDEQNDPNTNWNDIRKLKFQVFHYGIFAHILKGETFQTGIGEIVGNDFLITLAKYTGKIGSTDQQAGTLMHELGHNLGLNHGGGEFDENNNKPNLFSVLTYTRQFADIDSNRKLDYSNATLGHHHNSPPKDSRATVWGLHEGTVQELNKGLWPFPGPSNEYLGHENEPVIYSCPDGIPAPLLYFPGKVEPNHGVDWDCDGLEFGRFPANIDNFATSINTDFIRLEGHNDWNALNFDISHYVGNYAAGRHSKVASGVVASGGDGIPYGETEKSLVAKGLKPDKGYNFVPTGQEEITFRMVIENRILSFFSLYRQLAMLDESEFSSGFSSDSSISFISTDSMILQTQLGLPGEPKKDSFKAAVLTTIKLINVQDIQNTQKAVQLIDAELQTSLSNTNYQKIQPTISNLDKATKQALGFGTISMQPPEPEPIVDPGKIQDMIKNVEAFVDDVKQNSGKIQCNPPFVVTGNECVCPPGTEINEEADCVKESKLMVSIETSPGNAGEAMEITVTFTDIDGNPVEHVNYNIIATQGAETVLDDTGVHDHDGVMTHTTMVLTMAASDSMPVDVSVEFLGFGIDEPFTGPVGYVETAQVVPEFGTITMMILGVAIISIIALSAKSRVIPKL